MPRYSLFFLIFIVICSLNAKNLTNYNNFLNPKTSPIQLSVLSPLQPHASTLNDFDGISVIYSFPGFFSYYGQLNLEYTNTQDDGYSLAIGIAQIAAGINKCIYKSKNRVFYFNGTLGTNGEGYLGSAGFSYLIHSKQSDKIEFVFDTFFHHGSATKEFFIVNSIYNRGIIVGGNYEFRIKDSFRINIGTGISLIQYRYFDDPYSMAYYIYWDWEKRINNPERCKWDTHILIPIAISFIFSR